MISISPRRVLVLFLALNIMNYMDRQILSGLFPLLKTAFSLSDTALGMLGSAFMVTYSLTALPFGTWSDRWWPQKVAAIGAAVWSLATMSSALAGSFVSLFILRSLVGVGEAAYTATAGPILSSVFKQEERAWILGLLNLGLPIGGATGVVLGGWIGAHYGWHIAFLLVGIPGLILALFLWRMRYTPPGREASPPRIDLRQAASLLRNIPFTSTALGYAGLSFAFGAIVLFAPTYFERYFHYSLSKATLAAGGLQVIAGLLGAPIGGRIADFWIKYSPRGRAYTLIVAMLSCAISLAFGLAFESLVCFLLATFFLLWHVGVAASVILDAVERTRWNTASAAAMLIMHLLGDMFSPTIVGWISDRAGLLAAFWTLLIPLVFAAACFWVTARSLHRQPVR